MTSNVEMLDALMSIEINNNYCSKNIVPLYSEIDKIATELRKRFLTAIPVTDDEFTSLIRILKSKFVVSMGEGAFIVDDKKKHVEWLQKNWDNFNFFYWQRYAKYLEMDKKWNISVIRQFDEVTTKIVDLIGDPNTPNLKRRGLVIGDVQSGKTANYTAICNKATDCGYEVIIVLAGRIENLRVQTQERLDKEYIGRLSKELMQKSGQEMLTQTRSVGVGFYRDPNTKEEREIKCLTSTESDFKKNRRDINLTLSQNSTSFFVVKKNPSTLKNLLSWLKSYNADQHSGKINRSILIIDDEADNASINTQSEDNDPTRINSLIREILTVFTRSSYVGVTATPFANIFINPDTVHDMYGDDLFPRDYIYALSPPTNYFGPTALFGDISDDVPDENIKFSANPIVVFERNESDIYLKLVHKNSDVLSELPPPLREALGYFLLANAVRDIRGDTTSHRTMMINISRLNTIQKQCAGLIKEWYINIRADIRGYSKLSEDKASSISSIAELKEIWDKHNLEEISGCSWSKMRTEYLSQAVADIHINLVNGTKDSEPLDYDGYKENGLRVIAVGGLSLSRGLTLEGLCVSYIYRNTQMYDTLLQMGRWFGYRPNYEDLFKVWMLSETRYSYAEITTAVNELIGDIHEMQRLKKTPEDFGLRVRQDPNAMMIVTARNKMREGTKIDYPVSVNGRMLETPRLPKELDTLNKNEELCRWFISKIPEFGGKKDDGERNQKAFLWHGVKKEKIIDLVKAFKSYKWNMSFQSNALAEYIEKNMVGDWDVAIKGGQASEALFFDVSDKTIEIHPEERTVDITEDMIKISGSSARVGAGGGAKIGLTNAEIAIKKSETKTITDSLFLSVVDRKPLLMIHAIKCKNADPVYNEKIIFAIGLGFPGDINNTKTAAYVVNRLMYQQMMEEAEEEEEGVFEDDV